MADEEVAEDEEVIEARAESDTGISPVQADKPLAPPKYDIRPGLGEKFQAQNVKYIITTLMQEQLMGRQYRAEQAPKWAKTIANGIRQRVQDLDMKRYKVIVSTTLLEMKGAGVKCAQRCIWDPETDEYIDDLYKSDTIFCYTIVYGIYIY